MSSCMAAGVMTPAICKNGSLENACTPPHDSLIGNDDDGKRQEGSHKPRLDSGGEEIREDREYRQVPPAEILQSPFNGDVNPTATAAEEEALRRSIAENGVLVPLVCEMTAKGQLRCLAGTRRLRIAKELRLPCVPVTVMEFTSREAARQFAIRDNVERRQLSMIGRAKLANLLWASYEKPGRDGKHVESPRKRAAAAAGLAEGSLANFRFVIDSGFADIIADLLAEKLSIDAAYKLAKVQVDGRQQAETQRSRTVRAEQVFVGLKQVADILGRLSKLSEQVTAHLPGAVGKGSKGDQERFRKKLATARAALEKCLADAEVAKLAECLARVEAGM